MNRPGGVKIHVKATIFAAGSDDAVHGTAATRLVPPKLAIAPGDGLFATGSAVISATGINFLAQLRGKLDQVQHIACVGHTDDQGAEPDNLALGRHRADAVCAFLAAGGMSEWSSSSRGEAGPRATNLTEEGRAQNRYVEIHLEY